MKPKEIKLQEADYVVAVVPERAEGPGWSNAPTFVWIHNTVTNVLRRECIQPEERTEAMHALYDTGEAVHCALVRAVPFKRIKKAK